MRTSIYLCSHMVSSNFHYRSGTFTLTASDIDGMVPRDRMRYSKNMYLFHTYRMRETLVFGARQIYWYSWPEVRRMSYRSSAVDHR